jgi:hypothetical protein
VTFFQLRESFKGYVSKILGNPSPRQPDTRPATPLPAIPPLHASATQSSARCFLLPHNLTRLIPESIARNPACLAYAQDVQQSVLNCRVLGGLNIPRQSEQGFHGKKNTNSTAKLMPIPRQKEQGFHAIANMISGWRRRGSTVARSTVLSGVPNGKCQVDHAQNQGSAAVAFRV